MDWNVAVIVGSNVLIFLTFMGIWISLSLQMRNEMHEFRKESQNEAKDFHARMCKLEERYLTTIIKG